MACDTSHDVSLVYPDSLKNHNQALRLRKHSIEKENYFVKYRTALNANAVLIREG